MKGNSSSKKVVSGSNPTQVEQYKSQGSRVNSNAGKAKQGNAFQNMKEFKCQIDHEIAKCLDTLDRQGLKFLKETLRASKIFGLNTQQLALTQPLEQNIQIQEQSPPKPKDRQAPKKIEPIKNNIHIKKVSKAEINKKTQPVKIIKPVEGKNDLNQKINKKLDSLHIKTGKKNDAINPGKVKAPLKQKVEAKHAEIEEEIEVEQAQKVEHEPIEQSIKNSSACSVPFDKNSNGNPIFYDSSKQWMKHDSREVEGSKVEETIPSKPFCKKPVKKHHEDLKHKQHKDYGIQISKQDEIRRVISQSQPQQQHNISELKEELVKSELNKLEESSEVIQQENKPVYGLEVQKKSQQKQQTEQIQKSDPYMQNLISAISRLSPSKRNKLENFIQKLQCSDKSPISSFISNSNLNSNPNPSQNEVSYHKPYIAQKQSFVKNSDIKQNHSKSRSKLEKVEKATSLKSSLVKKINYHSSTPQNHSKLTPESRQKEQQSQLHLKDKQKNILERYDDSKSQLISEHKKEYALNPNKIEEKQLVMTESYNLNSLSESQTGQKLIKVGKKKSQLTNIIFKILSNSGHSSLVGLTAIQIFSPSGQLIVVDDSNLKSQNSKILRLFTSSCRGEGWIGPLSNSTIALQNVVQAVGGIRVVNWNKSELEVDRQADIMQIWINEQLHWRGQVKGGSYKENEVYATNIKVTEKHFEFPEITPQPSQIVMEEKLPILSNSGVKGEFAVKRVSSACWLQKETVEKRLKQIEEEERKDEKIKKIGSIRNPVATSKNEQKLIQSPIKKQKAFEFGMSWMNEEPKQWPKEDKQWGKEEIKPKSKEEPKYDANLHSPHNNDILLQLGQGVQTRRRKEESSLSNGQKKEEELRAKGEDVRAREEVRMKGESASKKQQEYLIQKEKEQDLQFQQILQSMEQRSRTNQGKRAEVVKGKQEERVAVDRGKVVADKNFEDFMKDSLFDDKPIGRRQQEKGKAAMVEERSPLGKAGSSECELDKLINELNDVVGEGEEGEEFAIPELPRGKEITVVLVSNWGNQSWVGLNAIELFDSEGQQIRPVGVGCAGVNSKELFERLFKEEVLTSDEKAQVKVGGRRASISVSLGERVALAGMRVWNFSGHRVHNNIGVRKLQVRLDGSLIFSGEVRQSSGSAEDAHKGCEHILFTDSPAILKKLGDNDWLGRVSRRDEEERLLFKTTLDNFHRPPTGNDQEGRKQEVQVERAPIRLGKRLCAEYDPPQLPQGFVVRVVLHGSWGDRFFIGLNGIELFNEKGQNVTSKNLVQLRAEPSSLCKLEGYERDKRVVGNLINGANGSAADCNCWLAPLLSDVEKIERGRANWIVLEYSKAFRIAGVNFYNYIKTPQRGAREIELFLDDCLLYRGYLRRYSKESESLHTTVNFTREAGLLEAMGYSGYNEDHMEQEVGLTNEEKVVRAYGSPFDSSANRPMTGKLAS